MNLEQESLLKDVHTAIVGNKPFGIKGLVERVEDLENKNKEKIFSKGFISGIGRIGKFLLFAR